MTSNKLQYFSQNDFSKGIETRQEMLGKGQVLDAQNMWAFLGECGQRPGSSASRYYYGYSSAVGRLVQTSIHSDVSLATDFILTPGTSTFNAFEFGDILTLHFNSSLPVPQDTIGLSLRSNVIANAVTKTRAIYQAWTSTRGWVNLVDEYQQVAGFGPFMHPFAPVGGGTDYNQTVALVMPADLAITTKTFTTGNLTGYFIRLIFVSAGTTAGLPFTNNVEYGSAGNLPAGILQATDPVATLAGYFFKYNQGNLVVVLAQRPKSTGSTPDYLNWPFVNTIVGSRLGINPVAGFNATITGRKYDNSYINPSAPPSATVVPEFNTAFVAYAHTVFEFPFAGPYTQSDPYPGTGTLTTGPLTAVVNTNPLVVGPISVANPAVPYSTDLVPQLTSFPEANLIVYFKDRLWAAGLLGSPNILRWSGSATDGAYNVWPEQSQVPLSTAKDNSEITAIVPMGDNLVVFKKNSIWQMVDNGISDTGPQLALYEPRLVVAGVGTVSHASVQAVNGGLIFLAEDGFYFYDGTPNIKRLSDSIKDYVDGLNPSRTPFAVSTVWRTKQLYLCAVSTQAETQSNDRIFVFDFQNGGWWIWNGLDVQCWYQQDGVGLKEELYALDRSGRAYQLDKWTQTDNGANIDSYVTTARIGFTDLIAKAATDIRVRGINNNPTVTLDVIADDFTVLSGAQVVMPRDTEAQYADSPPYTTSTYAPTRRRERKHSIREPGAWFQLKLHKMMKLFGFDVGFNEEGRR